MLPAIDLNSTRNSNMMGHSSTDKFISVVHERVIENKIVQKKAFTKQKQAHPENLKDVMYQVNLRDADFMKV